MAPWSLMCEKSTPTLYGSTLLLAARVRMLDEPTLTRYETASTQRIFLATQEDLGPRLPHVLSIRARQPLEGEGVRQRHVISDSRLAVPY